MARGGARPNAGRKKVAKEDKVADGDKGFATRVLERIGTDGWLEFIEVKRVKSPEDLALHYVAAGREDQFNRLIDRRYGKAVQTVNHVHNKPLEVNVRVSLAEAVQKARKRVTTTTTTSVTRSTSRP